MGKKKLSRRGSKTFTMDDEDSQSGDDDIYEFLLKRSDKVDYHITESQRKLKVERQDTQQVVYKSSKSILTSTILPLFDPKLLVLMLFLIISSILYFSANNVVAQIPTTLFSKTTVPPMIENNLANFELSKQPTDIPILFHVPRSAGTTFKLILSRCMGLVLAAEGGMSGSLVNNDSQIKVMNLFNKGKFVSIDVTSTEGLKKAKKLGLAKSGLADVIATGHFYEVVDILDPQHRGKMFVLMRDPIERSLSLYQSLASRKSFKLSLEEYTSSFVVDNWMVRQLVGKERGKVTANDLAIAKEILRKKFLIGLVNHIEEALNRFQRYINTGVNEDQDQCVAKLLKTKINKNSELNLGGDTVTTLLSSVNEFDIQLYNFATELYRTQEI